MIRNRLNILLAERNLNIKDVYENTGLSRTTVSNMINGVSDGLQMKTLDILCNYLEVSPSEFFDYAPFIIKFHVTHDNDDEIIVEVKNGQSLKTYWYNVLYKTKEEYIENDTRVEKYDLYVTVHSDSYEDPFLSEVFNTLSITLKKDYKESFWSFIMTEASNSLMTGNLTPKYEDEIIDNTKELKTLFRTPVGTFVKTFDPSSKLFI